MIGVFVTSTVYTFVCSETGEPTHIDVSSLLRIVQAAGLKPIDAEIGDTLEEALRNGRLGVEEHHALKLPEEALKVPALVCQWGERDHVIADGAHRLWRRWKRGDKTFPVFIIPERVWRAFTIPNEVMGGDGAYWDDFNRNAKVR